MMCGYTVGTEEKAVEIFHGTRASVIVIGSGGFILLVKIMSESEPMRCGLSIRITIVFESSL